MRSKQLGFTITELTILIVWILSIVGWVANIVKVVHMGMPVDLAHMSIMFVLRIIGIFIPPLGAVLGFM